MLETLLLGCIQYSNMALPSIRDWRVFSLVYKCLEKEQAVTDLEGHILEEFQMVLRVKGFYWYFCMQEAHKRLLFSTCQINLYQHWIVLAGTNSWIWALRLIDSLFGSFFHLYFDPLSLIFSVYIELQLVKITLSPFAVGVILGPDFISLGSSPTEK